MLPVNYTKDEFCGVISRNKTESDCNSLNGYKISENHLPFSNFFRLID